MRLTVLFDSFLYTSMVSTQVSYTESCAGFVTARTEVYSEIENVLR